VKKNGWILLLFVFLGLIGGALIARWLERVPGLSFLTRTEQVNLSPSVDLLVLDFNLQFGLNVSLLSIIGAVLAIWLYRRM